MEIELKLLVDPADADRLLRSAALRSSDKQPCRAGRLTRADRRLAWPR
jgi:hypothetical protein